MDNNQAIESESSLNQMFVDLTGHLAWPLMAIIFLIVFHKPVRDLLERLSDTLAFKKITLEVLGAKVELDANLANETLGDLKKIINDSTSKLKPEEIKLFNKIENSNGVKTVDELAADSPFVRGKSPEHDQLRNLRESMLIRPRNRGKWESDKYPVLTRFGRLVHEMKNHPSAKKLPKDKVAENSAKY